MFIVGAAKSGTTALASMLGEHSKVFLPTVKEPHFFPTKYIEFPRNGTGDRTQYISAQEEYMELYKDAASREYLIDATVEHLYYSQCAKDIFAFNPQAKIIIILRNPVFRAFSSYKHLVKESREPSSFSESLRLEETRIKKNWGILWRYKDLGLYTNQVKEYLDTFGASNVKIVLAEELQENKRATLGLIIDWLDLEWEEIAVDRTFNKGGKPTLRLRIVQRLKEIYPIKILAKFLFSDAHELYRKFADRNVKSLEFDGRVRTELENFFYRDIKDLERLINRDLSTWYNKQQ